MLLPILVTAAIVALDQFTKIRCAEWLPSLTDGAYKLWDGVLHLQYVQNRGAAFGMFQGGRWIFLGITAVACVAIVWLLIRERKSMHLMMKLSLSLILAGALGNLIDRAVLGFVRDMIYVAAINFPVFNVADMAVCIGCGLLVLDIFFFKGREYLKEPEKQREQ